MNRGKLTGQLGTAWDGLAKHPAVWIISGLQLARAHLPSIQRRVADALPRNGLGLRALGRGKDFPKYGR